MGGERAYVVSNVLGIPAYSDAEALTNFIEALKVAESAAKQMAVYTEDPRWLGVENALAHTRLVSVELARASLRRKRR